MVQIEGATSGWYKLQVANITGFATSSSVLDMHAKLRDFLVIDIK